ncbi:MAG: hypothetical protein KF884_04360 [Fimbriimonadaceae bacterium]|nr:hypothetical protein [Fimbriimonadaceae bacterium]QYK59323.1 MAG: hypothetical protein KF884_04360 [Fimbriimonadaceae bacterium]
MPNIKNKRYRRGALLVDAVVAAGISVLAIGGATATFISGSSNWLRGLGRIGAESQSRLGVRMVVNELREAITVTVDANGLGLTFTKPQVDGQGNFVMDVHGHPVSDGQTRRIFVQNQQLLYQVGSNTRRIGRGIVLIDPYKPGTDKSYRVFTPGQGAITRQLTVLLVTRSVDTEGNNYYGRKRETVFLRNIPDTTR